MRFLEDLPDTGALCGLLASFGLPEIEASSLVDSRPLAGVSHRKIALLRPRRMPAKEAGVRFKTPGSTPLVVGTSATALSASEGSANRLSTDSEAPFWSPCCPADGPPGRSVFG